MNVSLKLGIAAICGLLGTSALNADIVNQGFENFPLTTLGSNPGLISTNGWTINEVHIATNALAITPRSGTRCALLPTSFSSGVPGTNSYVQTPELSNGVGSVTLHLRNKLANTFTCELRTSTNGINWNTAAVITNASTAWTAHTVTLNRYEPIRLRVIRTINSADQNWVGLDDISTTEAPAKVRITDHAISPSSPAADEAVNVSAALAPSALASNLVATLHWSANGGSSNQISMATNSLSGGRYETVTPITNQPAFSVINYMIIVTFDGPNPLSPISASGSFFLRQPELISAYSSVTVKGGLTNALELFDDEYWMGVKNVGTLGATTLYFESVNTISNQWRDPAQTRTELPVFGPASTNAMTNIQLASAPAGWLAFSFDESSSRYGIQQADVQSFNTWTNAGSYTNYTIDGWTLTQGRATNITALAYDGRFIQFASNTAERAITSPALTNGIGTILFRYRNTETNGASPAAFAIQTRAATNLAWQTVETVTGIITPDYLPHRVSVDNLDLRYIRIAATDGTAAAQLLFDDIVVTHAGATLAFSGLANTPANPTITNTVAVSVDITPFNGAAINTNSPPTLWFRGVGETQTTYYMPITFNNFEGRGTLTNFPALVKLTTANTGNYAGFLNTTNGWDLRFWSEAPISGTELPYEIESFTNTGTSAIWVKIPALSHNTTIWATWGNTNYNSRAAYTTNGAVWTEGYAGVWHLNGDFKDSTSNGRNGINTGTTATDGISGGARRFGGAAEGDNILISPNGDIDYGSGNRLTVFAFARMTAEQNGDGSAGYIVQKNQYTGATPYGLTVSGDDFKAAVNGTVIGPSNSYDDGQWHCVAMTLDNTDLRLYVNGDSSWSSTVTPTNNNTAVAIGSSASNSTYRPFLGDIDEVRISTVTRSADWIWASSMNVGSSHDSFVGYGTAITLESMIYDPIIMTKTTGNTYTATIPRGVRGLMEYYVEATYLNPASGGYQTVNEPLDRSGIPAAYTNTDVVAGTQSLEAFSTTTLSVNPGSVSANGWTINETHIATAAFSLITPRSGSKFALLPDSVPYSANSGTNSYIETPEMTNGIGSISFYLWNRLANTFTCEIRISTNGIDWEDAAAVVTNTSNTGWTGHTVVLNRYEPIRLRIYKGINTANGSWVALDDISMTYPPAYVTASDFELHPAYPSQEEPTTVACTIESATTYHTAFNIAGTLKYRSNNQVTGWTGWTSVPMTRFGSRFYGDIPPLLYLSEVEYYVQADFKGYSAEGEDESPMTFPEAPLDYTVRRYTSAYDRMNIRIGTNEIADFVQLGNGLWEGFITFLDPTNQLAFGIDSYGFYNGTNVSSGVTNWGLGTQVGTNLPVVGIVLPDGSPITIPGEDLVGQFVIRFNETTREYSIQRAVYQDFENWPADSTYFGESYAAAVITEFTNSFTSWPLSDTNVFADDFTDAGWTNIQAYPASWAIDALTETRGLEVNYTIQGGILVTQRVGRAAALLKPLVGYLYSNDLIKEDVGTFAFDLRAASPNNFRPAIHPDVTNTHMRIDAKLRATDIPINSSLDLLGDAYTSVIGNYMNPSNYYEGRVVQISSTQKQYQLWEKTNGALNSRGTPLPVTGKITDMEDVQLIFYWNSTNSVTVRFRSVTNNKNVDYTDTTALTPTYTFGLNSFDSSISVDEMKVYAVTNSSFAIDPTPIYTEDFSAAPAGWTITDKWVASGGWFTRPAYTGDPITARIEYSTSLGSGWQSIAVLSNITHNDFKRYEVFPHIATNGYVRVWHFAGDGGCYLMVDNVYRDGWRAKSETSGNWGVTNAWIGNNGSTNNWKGNAGENRRVLEMRHSRVLEGNSQYIVSPELAGGAAVVAYEYRKTDDASGPVSFEIDYQTDASEIAWFSLTSVTNVTTTNWVLDKYGITDRAFGLEIRRIRFRNTTPGHDDGLLLDNIVITAPPPIDDTTWWGYNILVTDKPTNGIVNSAASPWLFPPQLNNKFGAFLNNSYTNDTGGATNDQHVPFIQSAKMPDGIGEIRFQYRAWDTNAATIQVVSATNRITGVITPVDILSVTNTTWQEYRKFVFDRDNNYVMFRTNPDGSSGRVAIENILITAPLGASLRMKNIRTVPEIPLYYEGAKVQVEVYDLFYFPTNIQLKVICQFDTNNWGQFTSPIELDMVKIGESGGNQTWETITPIPAQNVIDKVIQYTVVASYEGEFAEQSSPLTNRIFETPAHYWPIDLNKDKTIQTPYYIALYSYPGQIWMNSFKTEGVQFIELAGVEGLNIEDWKIESVDEYYSTNASFVLPNHTFSGTNGYGFFVLGASGIPEPKMPLPSPLPTYGGLQLVRPGFGIIDQQISYDDWLSALWSPTIGEEMANDLEQRFTYAGENPNSTYAFALIGEGRQPSDFTWTGTTVYTIGSTNDGQTLIPWPTNDPPVGPNAYTGSVAIVSAWRDIGLGRVYFNANADATNLMPSVWYVTNLLNVSSNDWRQRTTDFGYTAAGTNYQVWCNQVTPPVFYRIGMSVAP